MPAAHTVDCISARAGNRPWALALALAMDLILGYQIILISVPPSRRPAARPLRPLCSESYSSEGDTRRVVEKHAAGRPGTQPGSWLWRYGATDPGKSPNGTGPTDHISGSQTIRISGPPHSHGRRTPGLLASPERRWSVPPEPPTRGPLLCRGPSVAAGYPLTYQIISFHGYQILLRATDAEALFRSPQQSLRRHPLSANRRPAPENLPGSPL